MGWGKESLFKMVHSQDKDGPIPIYGKNMKHSSSLEPKGLDLENSYAASSTGVLPNLFK